MVYKWCVVPKCTNTCINSPQTLFVSVPTDCKRRKKWLLLARRDPKGISSTSNVFMCEDHFDIVIVMLNCRWKKTPLTTCSTKWVSARRY
ncbi:unnamed protein product [Acanthoscelides obtectus]|uniref:THAP-type domain-containing protein n=1 Tax=Acanthoscelides obtectus TaxID=200917 RepID=A0A9P0MJY5_ACAOB|nr:unnamed protein product [Acanthoscelides obtectus]CAK1665514.1 hypothetical protein AOBTE_LOCUS24861 [Acanthoscelides obtectus]